MRKTITIPEDASDGEISDAIEEVLERGLGLPVTLTRKDIRTVRKVIEAKRRRLRKEPKTRRASQRDADMRF
jgi:hypothetical protein